MSSESSKKATWVILAVVVGGGILVAQWQGDDSSTSSVQSSSSTDLGTSSSVYSGLGTDPLVLTQSESQALSDRLTAAYQAQGVCYGWKLNNDETGSNFGPGTVVSGHDECTKYVELVADYTYDSVEEEFTAVTFSVETSDDLTVSSTDLTTVGIGDEELLDEPNVYVSDAVNALPMLVAEKGEAPAVPAPTAQDNASGDTLERGVDAKVLWLVLAIVLLAAGLLWLVVALIRNARSPRTPPPPPDPDPSPGTPSQGNNQGMGSQ